ncbi:MAG: ComEC/Rec2 family competence protein [Candidatus Methylacidiphilales bacterium]|nr:ComEC/Rec2 family competence protein [Candidatus Methylacidiphilales bacterium]
MPSRAPLFLPSIAFAAGAAIQMMLPGAAWQIWFFAACICFCGWWSLQRTQNTAYQRSASFVLLLFICFGASTHSALVASTQQLTRDDISNLPVIQATHGAAVWTGTIVTRPRAVAGKNPAMHLQSTSFIVYVDYATISGIQKAVHGPVYVRLTERGSPGRPYRSWMRGDTVHLTGALSEPRHARNPGEIDEAGWLSNQNISWIFRGEAQQCRNVPGVTKSWTAWAAALAEQAREWTRNRLTMGIEQDPATCDLLSGMILGARQLEDPALSQAFRKTGTYHIFAVSGQNVMMVAAVGTFTLWILGINTYRWAVAFVPGVIGYCAMTGFEPSVVRAMVMTCVLLLGSSAGLPVSALNTWALSLISFLTLDPKSLLDIGFQLSFAVVLSLILMTQILYDALFPANPEAISPTPSTGLPRWLDRIIANATLMLASSLAAWMGSFPLSVWHFHQISFIALLANIPVVIIAGAIVTLGTVSVCVSVLSSTLTIWLNSLNLLLCKALTGTVLVFASVPGGSVNVPGLDAPWYPSHPHILMLDGGPGTGGSAIIRYKGRTWLINPGREAAYRSITAPVLRAWGVNYLEAIVSTELTQKQTGAAEQILSAHEFPPAMWLIPAGGTRSPFYSRFLKDWTAQGCKLDSLTRKWLPGKVKNLPATVFEDIGPTLESIKTAGPRVVVASSGRRFDIDSDFSITVLSPDMNATLAQRAENRSIVLLLQYKQRKLLWAGRIHPDIQSAILTRYPGIACDILVQAWNPLVGELQKEWIHALRPTHIVRPASDGQTFHLLDSTIAGLPEAERPKLWYQDETGALHITMASEAITLKPFITGSGQHPVKPVLPPINLPDYYRQLELEDMDREKELTAPESPYESGADD